MTAKTLAGSRQAWFLQKATKFYEELTPERTAQVLQNLGYLRQVNYQVERVLVRLAERQPEAVWDYFGTRLAREAADGEDEERFEAVPFQFHGLEKELSKDPQLAISKGLSWFAQDRELFRVSRGTPAQQRVSQLHPGVRYRARRVGKDRRRYGGRFRTGDSPELSW